MRKSTMQVSVRLAKTSTGSSAHFARRGAAATSSARRPQAKTCGGRPQLEKAIDARGAMIRVLDKSHLDLTTPIGRGFIAFLSALAAGLLRHVRSRGETGRS